MDTSSGVLIWASVVITYWGLFVYAVADIGMTEGQGILVAMFGFLIPLVLLKFLTDKCNWDWTS